MEGNGTQVFNCKISQAIQSELRGKMKGQIITRIKPNFQNAVDERLLCKGHENLEQPLILCQ